jgi:hypothetical protein
MIIYVNQRVVLKIERNKIYNASYLFWVWFRQKLFSLKISIVKYLELNMKLENYIPEDPVFSTSGQSARLEKKLLPQRAFISSISFEKSFFSSRALCPGVLKTGSSGMFRTYYLFINVSL